MRILLAEDEPSSQDMLRVALQGWGYNVTVVADGHQAWEVLRQPDSPKLAILDWIMPGLEGPEICRRVRRLEIDHYTYIIMLTVRDTKQDLVRGIEAGADDYIAKPFDMSELEARLNAACRQLHIHEQLIAAREMIRREAMRDPLTGVQNRQTLTETLRRELHRAAREGSRVGLAMIDVDRFKEINDVHGHLAGDEALHQVARVIQDHLRFYDSVGRFGGDEFLAVLPGVGQEIATGLCERLRQAVAKAELNWAGQEIPLAVSIGVTVAEGSAGASFESLVSAADQALYEAKREGRNRVAYCQPELAACQPDDLLTATGDGKG